MIKVTIRRRLEDEKLIFCTARGKDFYQQLLQQEKVAIVGVNKDYQMVRLNGKVKHLEVHKYWIDRIFEENPSMNTVYPKESRYILEPFCIEEGSIEFFDLGKEPIDRESFILGKNKLQKKVFILMKIVSSVENVKEFARNLV